VSDEDLGLPQSPITPQKKDRMMTKSEGSLSVLSMTSSDMDDENSSSNFDSSLNSSTFSKSFTYITSGNAEDTGRKFYCATQRSATNESLIFSCDIVG
jgi:hypothetical protein